MSCTCGDWGGPNHLKKRCTKQTDKKKKSPNIECLKGEIKGACESTLQESFKRSASGRLLIRGVHGPPREGEGGP